MPTQIFLVDDHPIVREGIARLIEKEPDLVVCGEADDAVQARRGIAATAPDLAIIDLSLKQTSGLDLLLELKQHRPALPLLVLSMFDERYYAGRAMRAGARGYVMKQEAGRKIIEAIRTVLAGNVYGHFPHDQQASGTVSEVEALSDRELQVFGLVGHGLTHQEIASRLHLSVKTIESHVERIKEKLDLRSGRALIKRAVEWVVRMEG